MLTYLLVQFYFNIFAIVHIYPRAFLVITDRKLDLFFYRLFHEQNVMGMSMLTLQMICNTLLVVYLWVCYHHEGKHGLGKRLFVLSGAVVIMTLQLFYWKIGMIDPPPIRLLPFPG